MVLSTSSPTPPPPSHGEGVRRSTGRKRNKKKKLNVGAAKVVVNEPETGYCTGRNDNKHNKSAK